jgi:Flp pilus assembly protein CpaB
MRQDDKQAVIANTVTVQVTPSQAEVLTMASTLGELKLILRPYGDDEKVTTTGATPKGIAQAGDKGDDSGPLLEGEPKTRSPLALRGIPDVPIGTKVAAAPVETKQPETPAPVPPKTHTLTIYNGDSVTKAVFTLSDKDGKGEPKNDKSPATKPAEKSPTKS